MTDFERARRKVPGMVWAFVDGGAESEQTMRDNTDAFDRWRLVPRVLTGNQGDGLQAKVSIRPAKGVK